MHRFETLSAALFAAALVIVPVVGWGVMMYRSLESTGLMIAALS